MVYFLNISFQFDVVKILHLEWGGTIKFQTKCNVKSPVPISSVFLISMLSLSSSSSRDIPATTALEEEIVLRSDWCDIDETFVIVCNEKVAWQSALV